MFLGAPLGGDLIAPLKLVRDVCEIPENIEKNIELTLSKPYVPFNAFVASQGGPVSIVGSGPSLARTYKDLVGDVIACNGAHDYLIERGIVPRFGMFFDASQLMGQFITPHEDVVYLIASRCHESVFKALEGYKVVVWHCAGDECIDRLLIKNKVFEPTVNGGSAAVVRTVFMAFAMGYRELHLHGADSSYEEDLHHVGKTLVPEVTKDIWNGRWFKSTGWMAGQVEDFRDSALTLKDLGAHFIVHGTGLLPSMAKALCLETPDYLG
jgi:hypothetical protein